MLIATPNLCLDITVRLPRLEPGTVARAISTDTSAGGKGVNVARAAALLGATPTLTGFLPTQDGETFERLLSTVGSRFRSVPIDGVLRVATILVEDDGRITVVNGRGPDVAPGEWQAYLGTVAELVAGSAILVCSGSLPPGAPTDGYRQLVDAGHRAGVVGVVDAAPKALTEALTAHPDLVCPNLSEAESVISGRWSAEPVDDEGQDIGRRAVLASAALHRRGAQRAVVTAGSAGAALTTGDGSWWLPAPTVRVVNPIGAGDCFVAGAALALVAGAGDVDIVRRGMSVASASCETPTAGRLDAARAHALFELIEAESASGELAFR